MRFGLLRRDAHDRVRPMAFVASSWRMLCGDLGDEALSALASSVPDRPDPVTCLAVGLALAGLSILARSATIPLVGDEGLPLLTVAPCVFAAGFVAGRWGGWTALATCVVADWYLFVGAPFSFSLGPHEPGILAMTTVAGGFLVQSATMLRRTIVELARTRERDVTLSRELEHRVKNALGVAVGVARLSFAAGRERREAMADFEERMATLGRAQALLMSRTTGLANVADVAAQALRPFGSRAILSEGQHVGLGEESAFYLSLVLHELATNSTKYGALSVEPGRVGLSWVREAGTVRLSWREAGGPTVRVPAANGSGTAFIERVATRALRGTVETSYLPSGLEARIAFPDASS